MSHVDTAPAASTPRAAEGRRPRRVKSQRAKSEARLGWLLAGPAFFVMLFVVLYPILQALYDSLFKYRLTAPDDREFVGLGNYGVILSDPVFWKDLWVTLLITLVTVAVELVLGFALALVSVLAILAVIVLRLFGADQPLLGQATTLVAVLFFGGVQLIFLGIIGEYLGRIYDEVKRRPLYIVDTALGFGEDTERGKVRNR